MKPVNDDSTMEPDLQRAYTAWMQRQAKNSQGERRRRLTAPNAYAEKMFIKKIWWPIFKHFDNLHAEYEIQDFKDGWRYLDFAYILGGYKACIEIDSYGTHWRDLNRHQFADHLMRQNHLVMDGWMILRFSIDDIVSKPRVCQQIIHQLLGLWTLRGVETTVKLSVTEAAIIDLAYGSSKPITPSTVAARLGLHRTTVLRHINALRDRQILLPTSTNAKRICSYIINPARHQRLH